MLKGFSLQKIRDRVSGQAEKTARNSMWLFASQAFGAFTALIYVPLLARYLGTTDYGRYAYAYAFVGLFEILSILGIHQIVEREIARDKSRSRILLGNALWIKAFLFVGTFILIIIASLVLNDLAATALIFIVTLENLIRKYTVINLNVSRAYERMEYEFVIITLDRLVGLVGVLFCIWADLGLIGIFLSFLIASVSQAIASSILVWRRLASPLNQFIPGLRKKLLKDSIPFGITLQTNQFYQRQGTTLLGQWRGADAVGYFSAGYRMYQFTRIFANSLVGALFPVFARLSESKKRLSFSFCQTSKYLLVVSSCIAIFTWAFSPLIVRILFGPEFRATIPIIQWLSPAIVLTSMNVLFSFFLQATNLQQLGTIAMVTALVLNLAANFLLIPRYGALGVVWALVISEAIAALLGGYFAVKHIDTKEWLETIGAPLLGVAAALCILFIWAKRSPYLVASAGAFVLLLVALGLPWLLSAVRRGQDDLR